MTTDTALGVTKMVVEDKSMFYALLYYHTQQLTDPFIVVPLDKIPFVVRSSFISLFTSFDRTT